MAIRAKPNEETLLRRISQGDEEAFAEVFEAYYRPLADYVLRLTDELEIAEEVVQDTFVKLWLRRETLTELKSLTDYLFILSRNQTLNHLRQKAKNRVQQLEWTQVMHDTLEDGENTSSVYWDILEQAVQQLPPQQQRVFVMAKQKRMKYTEIAQALGVSVETVKQHMKTALKSIRNYAGNKMDAPLLLIFMGVSNHFWI